MACALTQGYNLDCRDGYSGVKEVYIMEYDNATTVTVVAGACTVITKASTKLFYKYNLILNTGEGDENLTSSRENGTTVVKQMLKFPINKMTTAVRNEILLLAQNRLLIVVVDENGQGYLYGKDHGMMTNTISAKTGKGGNDRNGYELSFEGEEKTLAPTLTSTVISTLTVAGV